MLGDDPLAEKLQAASVAMKQLEERTMTLQAALEAKQDNQQFEETVKLKELELKNKEISIDAQKTFAEIEKMKAETQNIDKEALSALGGAVQGLFEDFSDVKQALEIMLDAKEAEVLEAEQEATGEPESPASQNKDDETND
jgi:hypothetical protein